MSWSIYAIIIIFAAFILILFLNPNLSCFGKRIRSPFYPLFRRKKKKLKTDDYGFNLVDEEDKKKAEMLKQKMKAESYNVSRPKDIKRASSGKKKELKTHDYGFSLVNEEDRLKTEKDKEK